MGLDELTADVEAAYSDLDGAEISLDEESRMELAMLRTALDTGDTSQLIHRAIHILFQSTVDTGKLDFHLRSGYDVTYDEYLSGMTYDEMTGGMDFGTGDEDDRRYQF